MRGLLAVLGLLVVMFFKVPADFVKSSMTAETVVVGSWIGLEMILFFIRPDDFWLLLISFPAILLVMWCVLWGAIIVSGTYALKFFSKRENDEETTA